MDVGRISRRFPCTPSNAAGRTAALFGTHLSTVVEIGFVANQHGEHTVGCHASFVQPSRQMIEGFPPRPNRTRQPHKQLRAIGRRDGKEPLLSCCVAYLQLEVDDAEFIICAANAAPIVKSWSTVEGPLMNRSMRQLFPVPLSPTITSLMRTCRPCPGD